MDPAAASGSVKAARQTRLPISVVVPTLNAADWIVECLTAIRANRPKEIVVVDGHSSDGTQLLAEPLATRVLREPTDGPAAARNIGGQGAKGTWIAFIDADVVVPEDGLKALLDEARERKLGAIQAGLRSSGSDYWSEQMAWQHNGGRSRSWFGVSATLFRASVFRKQPFDAHLVSGEDLDLRLRLEAANVPVAVSERTVVSHRFAPGFASAMNQWHADGAGFGRMVRKFGPPGLRQLAVPFAAAAYWLARTLGDPARIPYFIMFAIGNWLGAFDGLGDDRVPLAPDGARATNLARIGLVLGALAVGAVAFGLIVLLVLLLTVFRSAIVNAPFIPIIAFGTIAILVVLLAAETLPADHPTRIRIRPHRRAIGVLVAVTILLAALRLLGTLRLLN
jgi:hypothetical protein